jgi:hypothetical protein
MVGWSTKGNAMNTATKIFTHISDPAHGWLKVTIEDCNAVNLIIGALSRYSYRNLDTLYLEEDRDAQIFLSAYQEKFGRMPSVQDKYVNSPSTIRRLPRVS